MDPITICDAVLDDLVANSGLMPAAKSTWKYSEPEVDDPKVLPRLAVWHEDTVYELLDTSGDYRRQLRFVVAWLEYDEGAAETGGTEDAETLRKIARQLGHITARIRTYATGLPGQGADVVATLARELTEPTEGIAWMGRADFTVESLTGW